MSADEKRRYPRYPFVAEITYRSDSPPVVARISDLSEGGMFVDTVSPLDDRLQVTFSFHLPDNYPDIAVTGTGRVAWSQSTIGMGVEFLEVDGIGGERIRKFLAGV